MQLRLGSLTPLPLLALSLAACPTRAYIGPPDGGQTAMDDTGPRFDRGPIDADITEDTAKPPDDTGSRADVPPRPVCPPRVATPRTDPCPGLPDCRLPQRARVDVTGARSALTDFQVRVTLPASVRAAVGAACDRMAFRTTTNVWAPHFVQDCAMGIVWVRVPVLVANATAVLTLYYGGASPVAAAQSYDDTFDQLPLRAANLLGAWDFDEGRGSRTCPAAGGSPFDAFVHETPYDNPQTEVSQRPELWSRDTPPSLLNPAARFTRNSASLNFPRHAVLPAAGLESPNRLVNWQSPGPAPYNTATTQMTLGLWVYPESPANAFNDNFQTVICQGMPDLATRMRVFPNMNTVDNSIFNSWAIFFRSDNVDDTYFQGNSCVVPCTHVDSYAHITTREPLTRAALTRRWHFIAITVDTTSRPHATRRSFFDDRTYQFPTDLDLFPEEVYCPMGIGRCNWPPEAPIQYYPAPVVIGADMNDGEPQLGFEGRIDDLFLLTRAISPDEMRAYRERRQYSPDPITATVTP